MTKKDQERKKIPTPVLKLLCAKSGNLCAFEGCDKTLIEKGVFVGDIGHIRGVKKESARYDPNYTPDQLKQENNLILLCKTHHYVIDHKNLESEFTVDRVYKIKEKHEKIIQKALDEFRGTGSIADQIDEIRVEYGKTYRKLYGQQAEKDDIEDINILVEKLHALSQRHRSVLFAIARRSKKYFNGQVPISVITHSLEISKRDLQYIGSTLESESLIWIEQGEDPPYTKLQNSILQEISKKFDTESMRDIIVNLRFSTMD